MNENRDRLKVKYRELYSDLQKILFSHDLMGINFETNTDEYDPEIDTILPRLKDTQDPEGVSNIIIEEFKKWFGEEEASEIPRSAYSKLANDVWNSWGKFNAQSKT